MEHGYGTIRCMASMACFLRHALPGALLCLTWAGAHDRAQAQNTLQYEWDHSLGGGANEFLGKLIATSDGGFLAAGTSNSAAGLEVSQPNFDPSLSFPTSDIWMVKCDADGNVQWDARYGTSGDENFGDVIQTADGGYLLNIGVAPLSDGNLTAPGYGSTDLYVLKLNGTGGIQWHRRLGGSDADAPADVIETPDGGYLIGGYTPSSSSGTITSTSNGGWDYFVTKLNSNGSPQWDKLIGGTDGDYLVGITVTDGGYLLAGSSLSGVGGDKTVPNHEADELDMWIVKIDDLGNVIGQRIVGSLESDFVYGYVGFTDGGIILATSIWAGIGGDRTENTWGASDGWVVRLNADLDIVWDHSVGGDVHEDDFGNLVLTADGNILVSGTSYSTMNTGWKGEDNVGPENTWVVLIGPAGNKLWDKTVHTGYAHSEVGHAIQLLDGCYVVADNGDALVGNEKTDPSLSFDFWTVKYCDLQAAPVAAFDAQVDPGCDRALVDLINSSTGATSWLWQVEGAVVLDPTQQFLTDLVFNQEGIFPVTLIACNGALCDTVTQSIAIAFATSLAVDIGDTVVLCSDDPFIIDTGITQATFAWSLNGLPLPQTTSSIRVSEPGSYAVTVTDGTGCSGTDSVYLVTVQETLSLGPDTSFCADASILLQADATDGAFQWFHNGAPIGSNSPAWLADAPGLYVVHHTYACGTNGDTLHLTEDLPLPSELFPASADLCDANPLELAVDASGQVLWSSGSTAAVIAITQPGSYSATVVNACGSVSDTIVVSDCGSPGPCPMRMPNVFSPNGDGVNDDVTPDPDRLCAEPLELIILDRWGLELYAERAVHPTWNGRTHASTSAAGPHAPEGVYYYICRNAAGDVLKGSITLLR
ncbi:MAG: gliding motility-associated C-terminal domain-containing protein [Flavobacteriales bacterium]|nr:gliding motility-associated C-terminal domain-containing protein [Flavobacteriales bacterium]